MDSIFAAGAVLSVVMDRLKKDESHVQAVQPHLGVVWILAFDR